MQATILSSRVYGLFFALLAKIIPADTGQQLLFLHLLLVLRFFSSSFSTYTCRAKCLPRTANRSLGAKVVLTVLCNAPTRYNQQTMLLLLLWHDLYFNWSPACLPPVVASIAFCTCSLVAAVCSGLPIMKWPLANEAIWPIRMLPSANLR